MDAILWEWIEMSVRWLHVIAGIAWIGSSFYFVHLDLSLKSRAGFPEGAHGEAWQVHGGGFYHMQKYLVAPKAMPEKLTWFYWEAYTTWLSGMGLLIVLYYLKADLYMIDPAVMALSQTQAIVISVLALAIGYAIYEVLCRSPIGESDGKLAIVGFLVLVATGWLFTFIFSGRGAFVHVGALIGTCMVANVAHIIIPNQRKVVKALLAGEKPDPKYGKQAKQRSLHNNYLTLPVIFVMISNHYPLSFASRFNWVILAIILVVGFAIRHFYNERHKDNPSPWWTWGVAVAGMAAIVWLSTFGPADGLNAKAPATPVSFAQVEEVVVGRCAMCHNPTPGWPGMGSPPKGVLLHNAEQIRRQAEPIGWQAVHTHAMPPGNVTGITAEGRLVLAAWLADGAKGP